MQIFCYHGRWRPTGTAERKGDVHTEEGEPTDDKSNNNHGHGPGSLLLSGAPVFSLHHPLFRLSHWPGLVLNDMIRTLMGGTRHHQL